MENAKNCKNSKWDILGDFQTLCRSASRYSNYRFSSRQKIARIFALVWWLTFFLGIWNQTDWRFEEEFLLGWVRRIAAPPQCEAPGILILPEANFNTFFRVAKKASKLFNVCWLNWKTFCPFTQLLSSWVKHFRRPYRVGNK